jgi:hypothetical protein
MKIINLSFLLFINIIFSQTINVKLFKEYCNFNNIEFSIINNSNENQYILIKLEKFNSKLNIWNIYSEDVFSKPFKPLELTRIIEANGNIKLSFLLQEPSWINSHKKKMSKREKLKEKKGVFRMIILYGTDEWNKDNLLYTDSFIIN